MSDRTGGTIVAARGLGHSVEIAGRELTILEAIDLEISAGETVALVGRSGSGKSTLLNLIAGLEPVRTGELELFGSSMVELGDRERTLLRRQTIGFVYQAFNLIPTLTVAENILLPLSLVGGRRTRQQERLEHLLDVTGLHGRDGDFPDTLSGGEQQRVAIARAVAHEPPLLLADEPTGNLDAETGRRVLALLAAEVAERGSTLLLVTHSREVASIADRRLALSDGALIELDEAAGTGPDLSW